MSRPRPHGRHQRHPQILGHRKALAQGLGHLSKGLTLVNSFTALCNIEKPLIGADADDWGRAWNANADLLDAQQAGSIFGLTLSAAGSTATFGIAAGGASGMALASAYTKVGTAWAVGTGNGGIDTGAIANNTQYAVWLIQRIDTSVVDVLFSLSATAPTMPTNYTRKRRIGFMFTDGSAQWKKFTQDGNEFLLDVPVTDVALVNLAGSAAVTLTLGSVPTGVKVHALTQIRTSYNAVSSFFFATSLDQADTAPTSTLYGWFINSGAPSQFVPLSIRTNTSAQFRFRGTDGSGGSSDAAYKVITFGWIDPRGQF